MCLTCDQKIVLAYVCFRVWPSVNYSVLVGCSLAKFWHSLSAEQAAAGDERCRRLNEDTVAAANEDWSFGRGMQNLSRWSTDAGVYRDWARSSDVFGTSEIQSSYGKLAGGIQAQGRSTSITGRSFCIHHSAKVEAILFDVQTSCCFQRMRLLQDAWVMFNDDGCFSLLFSMFPSLTWSHTMLAAVNNFKQQCVGIVYYAQVLSLDAVI